jgi:hypothetical protein
LRHLRRVREFRYGPRYPASRALLLHNALPPRHHLEYRRRLEQVREHRDPRALRRKAKDFQFAPERHQVDSLVPVRRRVFVLQPHPVKLAPAARVLVCHCVPEADLQEDIRSVRAAPANEVAGPGKDLWADSVPVQPAEQEFRRLNPASRCMRGSRLHRVAVRSSRSAMRKASANSIRCERARVQAQDDRRKPSLWRQ